MASAGLGACGAGRWDYWGAGGTLVIFLVSPLIGLPGLLAAEYAEGLRVFTSAVSDSWSCRSCSSCRTFARSGGRVATSYRRPRRKGRTLRARYRRDDAVSGRAPYSVVVPLAGPGRSLREGAY